MKVILKTEIGKAITLNINPTDTFRDIKERMVSDDGVPLDLFVNGMEVTDDQNVLAFFTNQQGVVAQTEDGEQQEEEDEVYSSEVSCSVPGCNNTKILHPQKAFFRFPLREERRHQWLVLCQREELMEKPASLFKRRHAICADHFTAENFETPKELNSTAIPTVFPSFEADAQDGTNSFIGDSNPVIKMELGMDDKDNDDEDINSNVSSDGIDESESVDEEDPGDKLSSRLCRLCAWPSAEMVYIYSPTGIQLGLAHMINTSLPITVKKSDSLPKQLCIPCLSRLHTAYELSEDSLRAKDHLTTMMKLKYFSSMSTASEVNEMMESLSSNKEIEESVNAQGICCPLCKDEESVHVHSNSTVVGEDACNDEIVSDEDDVAIPELEAALKLHKEGSQPNECTGSGEDNLTFLETIAEDSYHTGKSGVSEEFLFEDIVTTCKICGKVFPNIDVCLDHSKVHVESGIYPCSLCDLCYTTEEDITAHFEEHKIEEDKRKVTSVKSPNRLQCACGQIFKNRKTMLQHSCLPRSARKQYKCNGCRKSFLTGERLAFHQKVHKGTRPDFCETCNKSFNSEGTLYYHNRMVHEQDIKFQCEFCNKRFFTKARLTTHLNVHTGERPFSCNICEKKFYDRATLKGHLVTHMSHKPFQCEICEVYCSRKSVLKNHMITYHQGNAHKRIPSLIHYYCKACQQTFTTSHEVVNHRLTHLKEVDGYACEYCEFCSDSIKALSLHQRKEHQDERPYLCSLCQYQARTLYEARIHRKNHISECFESKDNLKAIENVGPGKVCMCDKCGKIFEDKKSLSFHLKSCHLKDMLYECEFCEKKFPDNQRLTIHRRLHTGEKPFECTVCLKRFSQSSALYTHSMLHTGVKPHGCDICGKKFRIKADRDNHRRQHTGEKPFVCEYCQKTFRTGQVYYQHRMIHTGERRFPCDVCNLAFKRSHTLVVHKRIHTGEKPNICDICNKGFRQRTDMRKHRALHGQVIVPV